MRYLFRPVDSVTILVVALGIFWGLMMTRIFLLAELTQAQTELKQLRSARLSLDQARDKLIVLRDLKRQDTERFKMTFSNMAVSRKTIFEAGLSTQEERRLLEKQLDIMTTYLQINPALQRIFLFRGDQPLAGYLISYIPPRAFGGVSDELPASIRIVSKERYAHPERGQSSEVKGSLQWTPPQVGTSLRSNALGEFVIFTNSKLIIHGPPLNAEDHEKFPHVCLGLDRDTAQKLYQATYIGTRISVAAPPSSTQ